MQFMPELISVIIPVYNPGKYLYHCLDSIVNQTYHNLEIILVNDGSTDDSLNVCKEYAAKDSRITVIDQKNAGVSAARNRGMEAAHGDYYSFIDSDDYLELNAYELLIKTFHEQKPDVVCYEYFISFPDKETQHSFQNKDHYGMKDRRQAMKEQTCGVPFTWVKLFSKKIVEDLRFTVGLARGEDGAFNRYALDRVDSVYYLDVPLLHYVQSEQSAVRGSFRLNQLSILDAFDDSIAFYQSDYPELVDYEVKSFLHLAISLYCDMYADAADLKTYQKSTHSFFKKAYRLANIKRYSHQERLKFLFFKITPCMFAEVHVRREKAGRI